MIRRLDAWLGLHVFQPPIIRVCQLAGITQWAFYRYVWWLVALWCVWRDDHSSMLGSVWLVAFALIRTMSAGLALNAPAPSSFVFRVLLLAMLTIELLQTTIMGADADQVGVTAAALIAEYAATITTIPPCKKREKRTDRREALA